MTSTITITPTTNIKDLQVVDSAKVEKKTYNTRMDTFTFFNVRHQTTRRANLMDVSLYDDVIVENGVHYKILRMVSK